MPRKPRLPSSKKTVVRRWDSDGVDPEAPTSVDVLLHWLDISGNYQRWQSMPKHEVCEEIVACMKDKGIMHRGAKSIWNKLHKLEKSFDCASSWLVVHGHFAEFQRGQLMKKDQNKLKKLCPYYDELSIAFSRGSTRSVDQGPIVDKTLVCMQQKTNED